MTNVICVLNQIDSDDPSAAEELLHWLSRITRIGGSETTNENPGQTLQATVLVHEAYLRLTFNDRVLLIFVILPGPSCLQRALNRKKIKSMVLVLSEVQHEQRGFI